MDISIDMPLPEGFNEKCFVVARPAQVAFLAEHSAWASTLEDAKQIAAQHPEPGTLWIMQPVQVAETDVVPQRTKVRFTATRTRAKRAPKARVRLRKRSRKGVDRSTLSGPELDALDE